MDSPPHPGHGFPQPASPAPAAEPARTPIAGLRFLAMQARHTEPVLVRGTVTFCHASFPFGFLQDETGGVAFVRPKASKRTPLPAHGSMVEATGHPALHREMLVLVGDDPLQLAPAIQPSGGAPFAPPPSILSDLEHAAGARFHGEVVQTSGVVRSVRPLANDGAIVGVASRSGIAQIRLTWSPEPAEAAAWVNGAVHFTGVLVTQGGDQFLPKDWDAQVLVGRREHWQPQPEPMAQGVELLIEDDGRGFETHGPADRAAIHFGQAMLQERAARIHAIIQVRSELRSGTRLRLLLPQRQLTHE